jgi:hypothetical protein
MERSTCNGEREKASAGLEPAKDQGWFINRSRRRFLRSRCPFLR